MRRLLAIALGSVMAVALAYAGILAWYDGERIRSVVTERMLTRYGVVLHIDRVDRSFSPRPLIHVRGLRVANAASPEHELVRIEAASFRIHPLSLIVGSLALEDIVIESPQVTVPVDDEGALYWDPLVEAVSEWLHRFDWSLHGFEVRNLKSTTQNVQRGDDFLVAAKRIAGTMPSPADLTVVATDVQANLETTLPLRLTGTARLERVELGRRDHDLPVTLTAKGSIGDKALDIEAVGGNLLDGDPQERDPLLATISLGNAGAQIDGTMSRDHLTHLDLFVSFEKSR
ncbi:MAG TPA: AsmA family protein, partial [Woeseiaceae bacterium]|nr:AsmA family protein [Woeseiaceae bacterium]